MPGTLLGTHPYKEQDGEAACVFWKLLTGDNITTCLCEWQLAVKQVVSIANFYMKHPNKIFILINPEQGQKESQDIDPL